MQIYKVEDVIVVYYNGIKIKKYNFKRQNTIIVKKHKMWYRLSILSPNYGKYRVYQKNRNLGISQNIDIVLKTKDFRRLGI